MIPPRSRADLLHAYFRSGWAFLLPYLGFYLLYAWLKWPVNAGADEGNMAKGTGSSIPCLLHVYWILHVIHLTLAMVALRSWWRSTPVLRPPSSVFWSLAPWFGLGLLFWIPGVYLEFPADPWQHYARVNEWSWHELVTQHSQWKKSSYFLAYSLIGRISPALLQLKWFDVHYTGCCVLLCWQYYRLARAIGLSERTSLLFVLINVLTFGNNIFGFYRYYGMSSTVFAQLGAVAITRIAIEAMRGRPETGDRRPALESHLTDLRSLISDLWRPLGAIRRLPSPVSSLLQVVGASLALLFITAGNHLQGLLIAGAGVAAVVCWRLVVWRRAMIGWLALTAAIASVVTVLWWPRHPALDSSYVPGGWLTSWYAFNIFQPASAGFQRAWVIFGAFGAANLAAGVWLLRRNSVVGWLTVMPLLLLNLPCVAIPFASTLADATDWEDGYIFVFHRAFFAIPAGLALVAIWRLEENGPGSTEHGARPGTHSAFSIPLLSRTFRPSPFTILLISLLTLTTLPADSALYNRLFNSLMVPADDLQMKHVVGSTLVEEMRDTGRLKSLTTDHTLAALEKGLVLATPGISYAMNSTGATRIWTARKRITWPVTNPPAGFAEQTIKLLPGTRFMNLRRAEFSPEAVLFSVRSQVATLSGHWIPEEVALEHATQNELFETPAYAERLPQIWVQWISPRDQTQFFARGSGLDMNSVSPEDRGRLDSGTGNQTIRTGDEIIFKPVMRTFNNSGRHLLLKIKGPGLTSSHVIDRHPVPLGGVQWIHEDYPIKVDQPGRYEIEIIGTTFWPVATATVRYYFIVQP